MEYKETFPPESGEIKNRIVNYWTQRSHAFSELREKEQVSETGQAWLAEIVQNLPSGKKLKILDIGCGNGNVIKMLEATNNEIV